MTTDPENVTPEVPVPAALAAVDQDKMKALKEKLAKFKKKESTAGTTASGSEAVEDERPKGEVMHGKDVDWSEYDLEFNLRHLYPQAQFRETSQGPRWVAMVDEFFSNERDFRQHGKKVGANFDDPLNLGEYLNDMLNSPEGWRVISMLPTGGGRVGVVLQRQVPVVLPDPKPLEKTTEVAVPTDPELSRTEDAATSFMAEEGLTPTPPVGDNGLGE